MTTPNPSARPMRDVQEIDSALETVAVLTGYTFVSPTMSGRERPTAGLLPEEVQDVLPQAVVVAPDGYPVVSSNAVCALLVEAIKDQQNLIEDLYERVTKLEKDKRDAD